VAKAKKQPGHQQRKTCSRPTQPGKASAAIGELDARVFKRTLYRRQ
jgi:hypothetical protein